MAALIALFRRVGRRPASRPPPPAVGNEMQRIEIGVPVFWTAFLVAAAVAFAATPFVRRFAIARGAMDIPNPRKLHAIPVPRLGGLAVALALAAATLAALALAPGWASLDAGRQGVILAAVTGIFLVGALDDLAGLGAWTKLTAQSIAAASAVWALDVPVQLEMGTTSVVLGAAGGALSVLWIVVLTNAVNLLDVADGVVPGTCLLAALGLALSSIAFGGTGSAVVLFALVGALAGFLPHNLRTPRVFLGDSGSLLIGFVLGVTSLSGLTVAHRWVVVPAILALALPLAEVGLTVVRRILRSLTITRPAIEKAGYRLTRTDAGIFTPDRRHIPHRLIELGLSPRGALFSLWALAASFSALAVVSSWWPGAGPATGLVALAALLYAAPRWLYEELRLLDRGALLPFLELRWLHNRFAHVVFDGAAVGVSMLLAQWLARPGPGKYLSPGGLALLVVATLAGFRVAGLYRGSYRQAGLAEGARAVRAAVVGGVAGGIACVVGFGLPSAPAVWLLHLYLLVTLVVGARFTFRILEYIYLRKVPNRRRAVILGTDARGYTALHALLSNPDIGLQPLGFLGGAREVGAWFHGFPVYPLSEDGIRSLREELGPCDVVAPSGALDAERAGLLERWCRGAGSRLIRFDPTWVDMDDARTHVTPAAGSPAVAVTAGSMPRKAPFLTAVAADPAADPAGTAL